MREVTSPLASFPWPYVFFKARKPGQRKLSPAQQRILDTMREGVWYQMDVERAESCRALVGSGWCVSARIARRDATGKLYEPDPDELLLAVLLRNELKGQPLAVYRRVPLAWL